MNNEIKVIRKNQHKTSEWSGGTTTQLYIYPEEADYAKRDFLFRISSAKVEVEESIFTNLPGINREIMILDGELKLYHEGHHNIKLNKYEKDSFKGDWSTKSYGKVKDFNLMMNSGCSGNIEHLKLIENENKDIYMKKELIDNKQAYILYCASGKIAINITGNIKSSEENIKSSEENIELNEEDILVFIVDKESDLTKFSITNNLAKEANIIISNTQFS